jgi:predicted DNA-binding mobile mystery protein A
MNNQILILEQTDDKLKLFSNLRTISIPPQGWIFSIRKALKMSMRQLGEKLSITAQSIKDMEEREKTGSISINSLKKLAKSLNMKFVYGFIPETGSLEAMIEKRANEIAKEIVLRTSNSMRLEDQEVTKDRLEKSISEKTQEILNEMPKYLWD